MCAQAQQEILLAVILPEIARIRRITPDGTEEGRRPGFDPLSLDDGELADRCEDLADAVTGSGRAAVAAVCFGGAGFGGRCADRLRRIWARYAAEVRLEEPIRAVAAAAPRATGEGVLHLGPWAGCAVPDGDGFRWVGAPPLPGGGPGTLRHVARSAVEHAAIGAAGRSDYAAALWQALAVSEPGHVGLWLASAMPADLLRLAAWLAEVSGGAGENLRGETPSAEAIEGARAVVDRFCRETVSLLVAPLAAGADSITIEGELVEQGDPWADVMGRVLADMGLPSQRGAADIMAGLAALAAPGRETRGDAAASYPRTRSVMSERRLAVSPTEQRNPRTTAIDRLEAEEIVDLILGEDEAILPALRGASASIAAAVQGVEAAFRKGGRLFYMGAGTSGRLGVLDASECPPTFRAERWRVQGIISGGLRALYRSSEGAEDEIEAGGQAVLEYGITSRDVLCGIAASGTTPFVLAGLEEAERQGAFRILVTCNTAAIDLLRPFVDVLIALDTGPEVLTGSTRLKAGTATKQTLNIITTAAMIRFGKAYENLMVDLKAASSKLNDRAVRIVKAVAGAGDEEAGRVLDAAGWHVKTAIVMMRAGVDAEEARRRLERAGGRAADAVGLR